VDILARAVGRMPSRLTGRADGTSARRRPARAAVAPEWATTPRVRSASGRAARDWHGVFRLATVLLPAVVVFGVEYLRHEVLRDLVPEMWGNLMTGAIALGTSALILIPIFRRLEAADERLRATEIEHAVAEERDRLARELHDGVSQALFFLGVKARALAQALDAREVDAASRTAAEIAEAIEDTSGRVRDAIFDLRTGPEPGESIGAWARAYVTEFAEIHGLQSVVEEAGVEAPLPLAHALQTMAMIREALHNVAKHAHAETVAVRLTWGAGDVTVVVADNGRGLPESVPGPERGRYGLVTLREFAQAKGGTLTATPRRGGGTELTLSLPRGGVTPA